MAFRITTVDNPYNPFTQFNDWYKFDTEKGYNTCSYLARLIPNVEILTDEERLEQEENAIDEIVNFYGNSFYKKVEEPSST